MVAKKTGKEIQKGKNLKGAPLTRPVLHKLALTRPGHAQTLRGANTLRGATTLRGASTLRGATTLRGASTLRKFDFTRPVSS